MLNAPKVCTYSTRYPMSCQRLPTAKETVIIIGLVSSPELNGKQCRISRYDKTTHRYRVQVKLDDGSTKALALKPQNITLLPNKKTDAGSSIRGNDSFYYTGDWNIAHVLVPCHLENKRRYEQFRQCARSLVHQTGRCRIFISISGQPDLRQLAMDSLRFGAAIPEKLIGQHHQWIVLEEQTFDGSCYTKKSQFQHYKSLVDVSAKIKANAWLMFLDNDDMYHPLRVRYIQNIIAERRQEEHTVDKAFYCGGKLLIDVGKANAKFGSGDEDIITYDKIICLDEELSDIVSVAATARENEEKDVQEYFDFCVKTEILQRFTEVTPDKMLSHKFCDVRFSGSLAHPRIKCYDHPFQEWLLMHFRVSLSDRHERFLELDMATYTNEMVRVNVSDDDRRLGELTGLKDAKIAFFRKDIEECAIQCVHRDDANTMFFHDRRVPIMNSEHGHDIGTFLWNEVMAKFESYYTEDQAEISREWWKMECKIPPPPEVDEALLDDKANYW